MSFSHDERRGPGTTALPANTTCSRVILSALGLYVGKSSSARNVGRQLLHCPREMRLARLSEIVRRDFENFIIIDNDCDCDHVRKGQLDGQLGHGVRFIFYCRCH